MSKGKGPTPAKLFTVSPAVGKPAVTAQNTGDVAGYTTSLVSATSELTPLVTVTPSAPPPDDELATLFSVEGAAPPQSVLFSATPGTSFTPGAPGTPPVLTAASTTSTPVITSPPPSTVLRATIDPEIAETHFGDPDNLEAFYNALASQLKARADDKLFYGGKLRNMLPLAEYAREVALREHDALDDTDPNKAQALFKFQTVDLIYRKLQSLKALEKSNTRYTEAQYNKTLSEIKGLLEQQGISAEVQDRLKAALDSAVQDNLFTKRKFYDTRYTGNTGFDTTTPTNKIKEKYRKRVKIEHEGEAVIGTFSYNRSTLLGTRPFGGHLKLWGGSQDALNDLRNQSKEFVQVAINEYGKGLTPDKPINLYYTNANKPMPEAALQILMEYKMEAMRRGQPFYAKDAAGKIVEISPKADFNPDERAYFAQYAMETPKAKNFFTKTNKDANACAGYKLFKNVEGDAGKILTNSDTDKKDENKIFAAMEKHLAGSQQKHLDFKQERMAKVEAELSAPRSGSSLRV